MNNKLIVLALALCASLNALSQAPSGRAFSRVGSLDELLNRVPINGETVLVETGWRSNDWGGGRLVTHFPSSSATTNFGNTWVTTNGVGRWRAQDYRAPIQDARWWTAFGTGTNDTVALQALINTQPRQISLFGTPIITQLLITNKIILEGYGVTMYQVTNGVSTNFIQIASNTPNVIIKGITFDGRNQAARGIRADQNSSGQLIDCTFQNFQEFNVPGKITTVAFYINGGDTDWLVDGCTFKDLTGLPDGAVGFGTGFTHGIYVNREFGSSSGINKPKHILITRSKFLRILPGEDSDAIRWTDSLWTYQDSNISVDDCYFEDIGKRAFKASGSGGRFVNNIITNSFDGSAQASGWISVGNQKEQYAVASLYGRNIIVSNNKYNGGRIRAFFDSTVEASFCDIGNNIMMLSTNWGLNGLSVSNFNRGTIFGSVYLSSDMNVHDNYAQVVQYGVQIYSASTNISIVNNTFTGLATTNNLVEASSTNGWGRGIVIGRSLSAYPAGPVLNTKIIGNTFDNFGAAIELSETINTQIAANQTNRLNGGIVIHTTDPDSNSYPEYIQINGGLYGAVTLLRPLELHYVSTDTITITTNRRGQVVYDISDKALSVWDGDKWSSSLGTTKKSTSGGITTNTWYRVASMHDVGYGTRGTAKITIGLGGGAATSQQTFFVNENYSDTQITMLPGFSYTSASLNSNLPIAAVRVIRDTANEYLYFDFQPQLPLTSLIGVEVEPSWGNIAGLDPTNSWKAVAFTDVGTNLLGSELQTAYISNVYQKVLAFHGDSWDWWFAPDKFVFGEGSLARLMITNSVPTTAHTPLVVLVNGGMNYIMRDSTSGVLYASSYLQPYQTMKFGVGLTNVNTNITVSLAAGGNISFTTNGNTITIAVVGVTNSSPTNGTSVYVDGVGVTTANFIDSSELGVTYTGTNVTYSLIDGSITTNRIDSVFHQWISSKQDAVAFGTGLTNNGVGTVSLSIAQGGGIVFTTNSHTVTIASSLVYTNGLTNSAGVVQWAVSAGSNITLSTNNGLVTISAPGSGSGLGTNLFVNNVLKQPARLTNSTVVTWTVNAGGDIEATLANNSVSTNKIDTTFYNWINGLTTAPRTVFANGNQVDVLYTTTNETSLVTVRSGDSNTITTNYLTTGSVLKLEASGSLVQNPVDWDGGIFRWKVGGLTLQFTVADPTGFNIDTTNSVWSITGYITVQSAGASASVVTIGYLDYSYDNLDLVTGNWAYHPLRVRRRQSGTLDTTVSNTIDLTFQNFSGQEISMNIQALVVTKL